MTSKHDLICCCFIIVFLFQLFLSIFFFISILPQYLLLYVSKAQQKGVQKLNRKNLPFELEPLTYFQLMFVATVHIQHSSWFHLIAIDLDVLVLNDDYLLFVIEV